MSDPMSEQLDDLNTLASVMERIQKRRGEIRKLRQERVAPTTSVASLEKRLAELDIEEESALGATSDPSVRRSIRSRFADDRHLALVKLFIDPGRARRLR